MSGCSDQYSVFRRGYVGEIRPQRIDVVAASVSSERPSQVYPRRILRWRDKLVNIEEWIYVLVGQKKISGQRR